MPGESSNFPLVEMTRPVDPSTMAAQPMATPMQSSTGILNFASMSIDDGFEAGQKWQKFSAGVDGNFLRHEDGLVLHNCDGDVGAAQIKGNSFHGVPRGEFAQKPGRFSILEIRRSEVTEDGIFYGAASMEGSKEKPGIREDSRLCSSEI